jgi:membrane dipeptidase
LGSGLPLPPAVDLHEDVSLYYIRTPRGLPLGDFGEDIPGRHGDIPKYARANVRVVFAGIATSIRGLSSSRATRLSAVYGSRNTWSPVAKYRAPLDMLWEHLVTYYRMSEVYGIRIVERAEDFEDCLRGGWRLCFLLQLEGAEPIEDADDLVLLRRLGVRCITLTWNYTNKFASGCGSRKDLGLTDEGEELVAEAQRLGILVDLAHASRRTMLDVLSIARRPVIVSHGNARRLVDTPRNVDDEVLELLRRNGGVIGVSAIVSSLTGRPEATIDDLVQHFTYIRDSFGVDVLAIGTDFFGITSVPRGFESIDRLPDLYRRLMDRGFSEADIAKVAYGNVLRVVRQGIT